MTKSYSEFNRRQNLIEPNLVRQRLNFRGPIPSDVLNLYYDQFMVDYHRLNNHAEELSKKLSTASDAHASDFSLSTPDYYLDNDIRATVYLQSIFYDRYNQVYQINSATPFYQEYLNINKNGITSAKISKISHKISMLENLIGKEE